jgi:hypothetical protein
VFSVQCSVFSVPVTYPASILMIHTAPHSTAPRHSDSHTAAQCHQLICIWSDTYVVCSVLLWAQVEQLKISDTVKDREIQVRAVPIA